MSAISGGLEMLPKMGRRKDDFGVMDFVKMVGSIWAAMAPLVIGAGLWIQGQDREQMALHEARERDNYVRKVDYATDRQRIENILDEVRKSREKDRELLIKIAEKVGARR